MFDIVEINKENVYSSEHIKKQKNTQRLMLFKLDKTWKKAVGEAWP